MFERFDEHARQAIVLALDEARSLGHDHIGTEHVLLGLLRVDDDLVDVLGEPADARERVVDLVGLGESSEPGQLPFTPNAKRVLDLSAAAPASGSIGPPRLALVLLSFPLDDPAQQVLAALGVVPEEAQQRILRLLGDVVDEEPGGLSAVARRVLETAARHAEDGPVGAEHIVLALVLEAPDLTARTLGVVDGRVVQERLAGLLEGPERSQAAGGQDIAILEAALKNIERESNDVVTPEHLLLGLLEVAPDVVARTAVDLAAIEATVRAWQIS